MTLSVIEGRFPIATWDRQQVSKKSAYSLL